MEAETACPVNNGAFVLGCHGKIGFGGWKFNSRIGRRSRHLSTPFLFNLSHAKILIGFILHLGLDSCLIPIISKEGFLLWHRKKIRLCC